jgi:Fe-S-cluster containining protein
MSEQPWYHAGLQFTCTQCGDCCTGAPGYVWVNNEEIAAIAAVVMPDDVEKFEELYVRKVGVRKSLKEFPDGACVFFDTEKRNCTVYTARPRQCKTWPFWDSNLRNPTTWKQACEACPGSGEGKLHQLGHIEEQRKIVKV